MFDRHENLRLLAAGILVAALAACGEAPPGTPDGGGGDASVTGFDDHSDPRIESREHYAGLSKQGASVDVVKVTIAGFADPAVREAFYMDGSFYTLHDEWYWYRLLNGTANPGDTQEPVPGYRFDGIARIYGWARDQVQRNRPLPLDLQFVQDASRLYSPRFYRAALEVRPRLYGLASLMRIAERTTAPVRPEIWAFELEYSDQLSHEDLVIFFEELTRTTPSEIGSGLKWLVRSPFQEALAQQMESERLAYHDRILRYRDFVVPGEKQVYSEGLAAGRLRVIRAGDRLEAAQPTDILVLEHVPDFLPPCAGLVTSVPQTPLAHINVLARNRGIPNALIGGAAHDAELDQLGRVSAPVVLRAISPDQVELVAITEDEYRRWVQLGGKSPISLPEIDLSSVDNTYALDELRFDEIELWRPIIGGKSAGFMALMTEPGVVHPEQPTAISIKPYVEHLAPLRSRLVELVTRQEFRSGGNTVAAHQTRFLVLEGAERFTTRFTSPNDLAFRDAFLRGHPEGTTLGDFARAGGVRDVIRARPIAPATLAEITATLRARFGNLATTQGLRFRSSSNIEDIEGFNGAGLYDSNTGYLNAEQLADPELRKRTIEWAIKKTWASYWTFEAFEERRIELVDHLSGAMGVLVHARFDDDKELSNGVFTMTVLPADRPVEAVLELNAQLGAESVTNPVQGSGALPEVDRVVLDRGAATPRIERVRASNLAPPGQLLVDDARLLELFAQARSMTDRWLGVANTPLAPARRSRTLTLDFEFRDVAEGWPALASGPPFPRRFVVKQARPLEPGLRNAGQLLSYPIPKDLLARARRIERRVCTGEELTFRVLETYTAPHTEPDLGHSRAPFSGQLRLELKRDVPELGLTGGSTIAVDHLSFHAEHPGMDTGGSWAIEATLSPQAAAVHRLSTISFAFDGRYRLTHGDRVATGIVPSCRLELIWSSPADYLLELLSKT